LNESFQEHYASITDGELLHIAGDRRDLREEARLALDAEMARRRLTHKEAHAQKRQYLREDIEEARAHQGKRKKSKYFVTQISLPPILVVIALEVAFFLIFRPEDKAHRWLEPSLVTYLGSCMAFLAVQPWVRRTVRFWISLAISCVPEFFVSRWVTTYYPAHTNSSGKGTAFLSILCGYAVGGSFFLLLQKLKPAQVPESTE
jgi:hypothetical protein